MLGRCSVRSSAGPQPPDPIDLPWLLRGGWYRDCEEDEGEDGAGHGFARLHRDAKK
jgi:hypothetical protein